MNNVTYLAVPTENGSQGLDVFVNNGDVHSAQTCQGPSQAGHRANNTGRTEDLPGNVARASHLA